jgi:hypothetical protein
MSTTQRSPGVNAARLSRQRCLTLRCLTLEDVPYPAAGFAATIALARLLESQLRHVEQRGPFFPSLAGEDMLGRHQGGHDPSRFGSRPGRRLAGPHGGYAPFRPFTASRTSRPPAPLQPGAIAAGVYEHIDRLVLSDVDPDQTFNRSVRNPLETLGKRGFNANTASNFCTASKAIGEITADVLSRAFEVMSASSNNLRLAGPYPELHIRSVAGGSSSGWRRCPRRRSPWRLCDASTRFSKSSTPSQRALDNNVR